MRCLMIVPSLLAVIILLPGDVLAGKKEDEVISRVTAAYGGEKLVTLQSIRGSNLRFAPTTSRDTSAPNSPEGIYNPEEFVFDIRNGHASSEFTGYRRSGTVHQRSIFDGENVVEVNFRSATWSVAIAGDRSPSIYDRAIDYTIGGAMLYYDNLWVWRLNQNVDAATYLGREVYRGVLHDMIQFPSLSGRQYTLYISTETDLLTKVSRMTTSNGEVVYSFVDHQTHDGFTFAGVTEWFIGEKFQSLTFDRKLEFNLPIDSTEFTVPAGISKEPRRIDTSVMTVNRVADGIYHIGTGNTYSLFVDVGPYIIAIGNRRGLATRLEKYKATAGLDKPLRYQVISHHHRSHIRGVDELYGLGSTLVTVDDNVQSLRDAASGEIPDDRFLLVDGELKLGTDGPNAIEIYEITTDHVDRYLLFYIPSQKLAFVADHLDTPFVADVPAGNRSTVTFAHEIERLGLDIENFALANSPRLMSRADVALALEKQSWETCLFDRPICSQNYRTISFRHD